VSRENDFKDLRTLERDLKPEYTLKQIITEALAQAQFAKSWADTHGVGGSATARFKKGACDGFDVKYSYGDIGNLVHELTHIAAFRSYKRDFVGYQSKNVTTCRAEYKWDGAEVYAINMGDRMAGWADKEWQGKFLDHLSTLRAGLAASGLPEAQKTKIQDKISYAYSAYVDFEYETVLNQILTWLHLWGYPLTAAVGSPQAPQTAYWKNVNQLATEAFKRRQSATLLG